MRTPVTLTLSAVLALVLAACGGGGSDETMVAPLPAASTFYDPGWIGAFGATISGTKPLHLVAATSEEYGFMGVYGEDITTDFKARGLLLTMETSDPAVTPARYRGFNFDLALDPTVPAMSGTMTAGSEQKTIAGGAIPAVGYRLDLNASLAAVAGHWELTTDSGSRIAIDVDSVGIITGRLGLAPYTTRSSCQPRPDTVSSRLPCGSGAESMPAAHLTSNGTNSPGLRWCIHR